MLQPSPDLEQNDQELALLLETQARRQVRRSLIDWSRYCGFEPAAHHRLILEKLEKVAKGEITRLMLFLPPGSAKSTYASILFPPWLLAQTASSAIIAASHTAELAERWGRRVRNLINEHAVQLGVGLSPDNMAAGRWETTAGGEYFAAGVGGSITGRRADLALIDDPVRSREDADSETVRNRTWDWYRSDLYTRLKPGARIVLIQTRWHEDDLAGRLLADMAAGGDQWDVVSLPALAESDDPLGRPVGAPLWPEWEDEAALAQKRRAVGARDWAALYQQRPAPEEGDYFKADWFRTYTQLPHRDEMRVYGASDYAVTAKGGDYTVHIVVGVDPDGRMHVLDLWRGQTGSDAWIEAWCDLVMLWKPLEWAEEGGQIKAAIGPFLQRRAMERGAAVYRRSFPTKGDKAIRAQSIRGRMAMQGLWLPANEPWVADFIAEMLSFPAGKHDDQCLVGETLVTMSDGSHAPLDLVEVGDSVLVPDGCARIVAKRLTNASANVLRIVVSDGRVVTATGNHPFFVVGKGFVPAGSLLPNDRLLCESESICEEGLRRQRWSSIRATAIGAIQTLCARLAGAISTGLSRAGGFYTGICGRTPAVLSRPGVTYTIETRTGITTSWTTSSVSRRKSTGQGIQWWEKPWSANASTWIGSGRRLPSGIGPTKDALGTRNMARIVGEIESSKPSSVFAARRPLRQSSTAPSIALRPAVSVISIEALIEPRPVWNITVSGDHVFYANGLLTHNCDALGLIGQLLDHVSAGSTRPVEKPVSHEPPTLAALVQATDRFRSSRGPKRI